MKKSEESLADTAFRSGLSLGRLLTKVKDPIPLEWCRIPDKMHVWSRSLTRPRANEKDVSKKLYSSPGLRMNQDDGKELSPLWLSAIMKRTQGWRHSQKQGEREAILSPTHLQANDRAPPTSHTPTERQKTDAAPP